MRITVGADLGHVVAVISAVAGCQQPCVRIKQMRTACYNPFLHRISISGCLAQQLPPAILRVLVAHEVAHATQRREILRDGCRILSRPVRLLVIAGTLAVAAAACGELTLAFLLTVAGLLVVPPVERHTSRLWTQSYLNREIAADASANRFVDRPRATEEMLRACAMLEDGGVLGTEAESRIAALTEKNGE